MMKLSTGKHLAPVNGLLLNYFVTGKGPLLFITSPGWGIGSTYLRRGLISLARHFKLVFIDTRGSGKSAWPADAEDMGSTEMADDIEQLRQYLGVGSIDLLGHSSGSAIALAYAERYGPTLRKLVLIDSQLIGLSNSEATRTFLEQPEGDARYQKAGPCTRVSRPTTDDALGQHLDELLPLFFRDPGENLPLLQTAMAGPNSSWVSHAQGAADRLSSAEQSVASANICAQTLILVGRHDWLCPVAISEQLHAGLQRSKLVVFENAGHFPWIEEPDRFFPEVTDFLLIDA